MTVRDQPALRLSGSFTLTAWIAATRHDPLAPGGRAPDGDQGILTKWSARDQSGYGLFIENDGRLALWLTDSMGIVFLVLNVSWVSMLVAVISARFRDIPQAVQSLTQAAAIMTPVFWRPDRIPAAYHWILDFNPFYHLLEAIRAPLLGTQVAPHTYSVLAAMAAAGWAATFWLFARTRRRIVHYL